MASSEAQRLTLDQLGWRPFYQQQLDLNEWDYPAARVTSQHRTRLELLGEAGELVLDLHPDMPAITVGDWLILTPEGHFHRLLDRHSLFRRKAAGERVAEQLIASNVDTLFIVTSLNEDFNLSRIERYLSLANEANSAAVVVLSKADLCDDRDSARRRVQALDPLLMVEAMNCLDTDEIHQLKPWCGTGQTVALMGSSGVGKSTLVNTLLGGSVEATAPIRESDGKGRHTTTCRSLHLMPQGGLLLDTPGMRELQLAGCNEGINATFADITALSEQCRFADCGHDTEPGCAVQAALAREELDPRRLANYRKLMREQEFNAATLAEKRARDRSFGKMVKTHMAAKQRQKN